MNESPSGFASNPKIVIFNQTPYVTWDEDATALADGKIRVKKWNGSDWEKLGDTPLNYDINNNANYPSLAFDNHYPYVTWEEYQAAKYRVFVKSWNGMQWGLVGTSEGLNWDLNANAFRPKIACAGDTPYVTWYETDGSSDRVYVKRWNGSEWEKVGGGCLNMDANETAHYPDIVAEQNTPYVTWMEYTAAPSGFQIYVKHWNGFAWEQLGNTSLVVRSTGNAQYPRIAINQLAPIVTWFEKSVGNINQVMVKQWNGSDWEWLGNTSLNLDANEDCYWPSIQAAEGTPYVAWEEDQYWYRIYVKKWDGAQWEQVGTYANVYPYINAGMSSVAVREDIPYVAWEESGVSGGIQIYVKHYMTPTPTPTATATATPSYTVTKSPTHTCTFTSTVTSTSTITMTPTHSPTFTVTHTNTVTSTPTATFTHSASLTITETGTTTPSYTPSLTASDTATVTPTMTISVTATNTPTITSTTTNTKTGTITATASTTPTITVTAMSMLAGAGKTLFYPNPARTDQKARFVVRAEAAGGGSCSIEIMIYNSAGERVARLELLGRQGENLIPFAPENCAPGLYFYRVIINGQADEFRKLVLIKP